MKILCHDDVLAALKGRELAVLNAVQSAYILHSEGQSQAPFPTFLWPVGAPGGRAIALPAYLGGRDPVVGISWLPPLPENAAQVLEGASSVMVLNDVTTGSPRAVLEASQISTSGSAASAALASHFLHGDRKVETVGLIGCGPINHRVMSFLTLVHPEIRTVLLDDATPEQAAAFATELRGLYPHVHVALADLAQILDRARTVSIATNEPAYWLDLERFRARPTGQVVLHLTLRDLTHTSILRSYNVVDDVDHACREQTSLHRAEQEVGHRAFIHATIGDLLAGRTTFAPPEKATVIFSPFGLAILDLVVAAGVLAAANRDGIGLSVDGFAPERPAGAHRLEPHPDLPVRGTDVSPAHPPLTIGGPAKDE